MCFLILKFQVYIWVLFSGKFSCVETRRWLYYGDLFFETSGRNSKTSIRVADKFRSRGRFLAGMFGGCWAYRLLPASLVELHFLRILHYTAGTFRYKHKMAKWALLYCLPTQVRCICSLLISFSFIQEEAFSPWWYQWSAFLPLLVEAQCYYASTLSCLFWPSLFY